MPAPAADPAHAALAEYLRENLLGGTGESCDLLLLARTISAVDSAGYYLDHMTAATLLNHPRHVLDAALSARSGEGLTLEFGVGTGRTLAQIAAATKGPVYGFDSFQGLPEAWKAGRPKGYGARDDMPAVPANAELVVGPFEATLEPFLARTPGPATLLHIDCDVYSSTRTVFEAMAPRIVAGTVILFGAYFNYPGWRQHEHRAFAEYVAANGVTYEYIAVNRSHQGVAVRILRAPGAVD